MDSVSHVNTKNHVDSENHVDSMSYANSVSQQFLARRYFHLISSGIFFRKKAERKRLLEGGEVIPGEDVAEHSQVF